MVAPDLKILIIIMIETVPLGPAHKPFELARMSAKLSVCNATTTCPSLSLISDLHGVWVEMVLISQMTMMMRCCGCCCCCFSVMSGNGCGRRKGKYLSVLSCQMASSGSGGGHSVHSCT